MRCFSPASFLAAQVGAAGGIRTLEPLSGYTISSRARYDHFDTTASLLRLFQSPEQQNTLYHLFKYSQALFANFFVFSPPAPLAHEKISAPAAGEKSLFFL